MRLTGNLLDIKTKREDKNQDIQLEIDKIEYITHKKDGKYFQPFEFIDELETPLVITGDCLARNTTQPLEEGEYEFKVYDKTDDAYVLNPDKQLHVTLEHDFDSGLTILTFGTYVVTVSNEEFQQLKSERAKQKKQKKGRKNR
ncbi:hypothetical protein [Botryobacter ruber]|uniref:hypothetical protein n=1 Tax=Botryobacter ruber TaxID=2171629 RepID=UPI000E0BDC6F|nr:hypothetical protein [Botryobacter ruber]